MKHYIVSYDLNRPGQFYQPIVSALNELRAKRIQGSVWIVKTNLSFSTLQYRLSPKVDRSDNLMIAEMGKVYFVGRDASSHVAWVNSPFYGNPWPRRA